ncbi:magnesium transporter [Paenibacillus sp. GCM10027626]|uniref:magnesium transporter n=1 Tax=Paenibacillus sp. GCM10027626 TaxID=3273411 RepID=UPI00362C80CA
MEELKQLLQSDDDAAIVAFCESYRPYDLAEAAEQLSSSEQLRLVRILPTVNAAEMLEYFEPLLQYRILNRLEREMRVQLLSGMASDVVADMMLAIHRYQADQLLDILPEDYRRTVQKLMTYPEDTAGSLATADYIAAQSSWTIERTLRHIRKVGRAAEITSYVYVIDTKGELIGAVSLRQIILAEPNARLSELLSGEVISVPALMEQEEVAVLLSRYDLVALPVIDDHNRLVGVISVDDLIDVIHEEATEDIQKLGGSQPLTDTYFKSSIFQLYRKRIVWLLILFVAEAYTGTVLRHYEDTLSEVISLAFFIPLLIGTGGNTGTQTVSMLVRALAIGEVQFRDIFKVIRREVATGLMTGASISIIAYARAWMLGVEPNIGLVVGITAMTIVIWASFVGAILPLVLHKLKADPAVVSGPFITTLVDGTGLIIYFTIAKIILHLS